MIPPDAYPQMVSKAQAAAMARTLRSAVTAVTASRVIEDSGETLRDAVRHMSMNWNRRARISN